MNSAREKEIEDMKAKAIAIAGQLEESGSVKNAETIRSLVRSHTMIRAELKRANSDMRKLRKTLIGARHE